MLRALAPHCLLWWRANAWNVSFENLYGGQFTLTTQLIKPELAKLVRKKLLNGKSTLGILLYSNLWNFESKFWFGLLCFADHFNFFHHLSSMDFMKSQSHHANSERKRRTEWRRFVEQRRLKLVLQERRLVQLFYLFIVKFLFCFIHGGLHWLCLIICPENDLENSLYPLSKSPLKGNSKK